MITKNTVVDRDWMKMRILEELPKSTISVTFEKKNGTIREMICTLRDDIIPPKDLDSVDKTRTKNENVCPVWDVEVEAWRSFRWDSIIDWSLKTHQWEDKATAKAEKDVAARFKNTKEKLFDHTKKHTDYPKICEKCVEHIRNTVIEYLVSDCGQECHEVHRPDGTSMLRICKYDSVHMNVDVDMNGIIQVILDAKADCQL